MGGTTPFPFEAIAAGRTMLGGMNESILGTMMEGALLEAPVSVDAGIFWSLAAAAPDASMNRIK
jgi:hypothetical protein